jgi:DnaJ-class molecular chaperone
MKVCPECRGRGRVEDEDGNMVTCPECQGSGVVDDHHDDDPGTIREPPG